jgi:hypothetical protein
LRIDWETNVLWLVFLLLFCLLLFTGQVKPEATVTDWIAVFLTLTLASYALQAIREAKRDRRKDLIEKKLSEVYSPLFEILERARWDTKRDSRDMARRATTVTGPRAYALTEKEFEEIRRIIERFGHFIESKKRDELTKTLDDHETCDIGVIAAPRDVYYRLKTPETDALREYIKKRREELSQELEKLAEKA